MCGNTSYKDMLLCLGHCEGMAVEFGALEMQKLKPAKLGLPSLQMSQCLCGAAEEMNHTGRALKWKSLIANDPKSTSSLTDKTCGYQRIRDHS